MKTAQMQKLAEDADQSILELYIKTQEYLKERGLLPQEKPEPKEEPAIWVPQIGERFWTCDSSEALNIAWHSSTFNDFRLIIGNVHKTKEEAKQWWKLQEARYNVRKAYKELVGNWKWDSSEESANFPIYDYSHKKWYVEKKAYTLLNQFPFLSSKLCKQFTDKVGDDLLLVMEAGI